MDFFIQTCDKSTYFCYIIYDGAVKRGERMNEKKMIRLIQNHDTKAFEKLIDKYSRYISAVIYNVIGTNMTREDIEEVASDVFVSVWNSPQKLCDGKIKQLLSAIARNLALNKLREIQQTVSVDENEFLLFDDNFESEIDRYEKAEIINDALNTLSDTERDIFIRFYYLGQTSSQISEKLNITVTNVTTTLSRGRRKMKKYLNKNNITM